MEQDKIPPEENKADKNNPTNPIGPIIVAEIAKSTDSTTSPKSEQDNTKDDKNPKHKIWWKHNWLSVVLALATIGTLIAYIVVSVNQNSLTRIALIKTDIANSTTRRSMFETKRAVDVSKDAFNHSVKEDAANSILAIKDTLARERNTKKELRAYIAITKFNPIIINKDYLIWEIEEINTGKTPAYKMTGTANYKPGGTGVYDKEIKNININYPMIVATTQGNGLNDTLRFAISDPPNISAEKIDKITKKGDLTLYIYGYIEYLDVFREKHRTRFCYYSLPDLNGQHVFMKYSRYNDGD